MKTNKILIVLVLTCIVILCLSGCDKDAKLELIEASNEDIIDIRMVEKSGEHFLTIAVKHSNMPNIAAQSTAISMANFSLENENNNYLCDYFEVESNLFSAQADATVFVPDVKLVVDLTYTLLFSVPEDFELTDDYALVYRTKSYKSVCSLS